MARKVKPNRVPTSSVVSRRLPLRMREATIEGLDPQQFKVVVDYSEKLWYHLKSGKGLLLSGPPGVGKTWAISALTNKFVGMGWASTPIHEFVTAPTLFDLYASIDPGVDAYTGLPYDRLYESCLWLVINDLGKEYRGGKLEEQIPYKLGRLLRARNEKRRVTHITTNLAASGGPQSIVGVYGKSIASLLSEMVSAYVITGPDRRKE